MGFNFTMTNSKVSGNASVANDMEIRGEANFHIDGVEITDQAEMLNRIKVEDIVERVKSEITHMDAEVPEYGSLKEIAESEAYPSEGLKNKIRMHLTDFANGTLQNIVAQLVLDLGMR